MPKIPGLGNLTFTEVAKLALDEVSMQDIEVLLALFTLFGGAYNFGTNVFASGSAPSASNLAAILQQSTLLAGKTGNLDFLGKIFKKPTHHPKLFTGVVEQAKKLHEAEVGLVKMHNFKVETRNAANKKWFIGGIRPDKANNHKRYWWNPLNKIAVEYKDEPLVPIPQYKGDPINELKDRDITEDFSPMVWLLQLSIILVQSYATFWGVRQPDQGEQFDVSNHQLKQAFHTLHAGKPDWTSWMGPSSAAYTDIVEMMRVAAGQAGVDGMFAPWFGTSLNTTVRNLIQKNSVENGLWRIALAAMVTGLSSVIDIALFYESWFPGGSYAFQLGFFGSTIVSLYSMTHTAAGWSVENAENVDAAVEGYNALIASLPTIPGGTPRLSPWGSADAGAVNARMADTSVVSWSTVMADGDGLAASRAATGNTGAVPAGSTAALVDSDRVSEETASTKAAQVDPVTASSQRAAGINPPVSSQPRMAQSARYGGQTAAPEKAVARDADGGAASGPAAAQRAPVDFPRPGRAGAASARTSPAASRSATDEPELLAEESY